MVRLLHTAVRLPFLALQYETRAPLSIFPPSRLPPPADRPTVDRPPTDRPEVAKFSIKSYPYHLRPELTISARGHPEIAPARPVTAVPVASCVTAVTVPRGTGARIPPLAFRSRYITGARFLQ